jgi:hypothetical protein
VENLDYHPKGSKERKELLKDRFGTSKVYKTKDEVYKQAIKIYDEIMASDFPVIEYGICDVGEYESFV